MRRTVDLGRGLGDDPQGHVTTNGWAQCCRLAWTDEEAHGTFVQPVRASRLARRGQLIPAKTEQRAAARLAKAVLP